MQMATKDSRQPLHAPMRGQETGAMVASQRSQRATTGRCHTAAAAATACRARTLCVNVQPASPRQAPMLRHNVHRPHDRVVMLMNHKNRVSAQLMVLMT